MLIAVGLTHSSTKRLAWSEHFPRGRALSGDGGDGDDGGRRSVGRAAVDEGRPRVQLVEGVPEVSATG